MKRLYILTFLLICNFFYAQDSLYVEFKEQANFTKEIKTDTITNKKDLDKYIGKVVTIKGSVSNTFIPTILGVDVSCENASKRHFNLQGKTGVATGVLNKTVVKKVVPFTQSRGVGVFYSLTDVNSKEGFYSEVKIID